MLKTRSSNATAMAPRTGRFFGTQLLAFLFILTSLPIAPAVLASHPTPPEAASSQPQDSPTPTPTPTEEELGLQQEKKLLELQRDIELAKKAIRDAQPQPAAPPTPSATPLSGDTTLSEGSKLEAEMVSYRAMSAAAKIISAELKKELEAHVTKTIAGLSNSEADIALKNSLSKTPSLAIYDAQVVKDWRFYQALFPAFDGQVKDLARRYATLLCSKPDLSDEFKTMLCDANRARDFRKDKSLAGQLVDSILPTAFGAGTNLLKSFVDLAALFRTDTKIDAKAVTIEEAALVAEIFRSLKNDYGQKEIDLYYPEVFPPRVPPSNTASKDSITVTTIGTLFIAKKEADRVIKGLNDDKAKTLQKMKVPLEERAKLVEQLEKVESLESEIENLQDAYEAEDEPITKKRIANARARVKTEFAKLPVKRVLEGQIKTLDDRLAPDKQTVKKITEEVEDLTALNEMFESFVTEFVKVDANGVNALALFIKSEDIENALPEANSYWLEVRSVSAGGNNRVRKNLLRYFSGAKVDHSGGIILEYTLYKRSGAVIYSDKLSYYEGYLEPKKIKDRAQFADPVLYRAP